MDTTPLETIPISSLLIAIIPIIITAVIGYIVSKHQTKNKIKYELTKKSFDYVYLPLFKMLKDVIISELSKDELSDLYSRISKINENYLEYTNPILNDLLKKLNKEIKIKDKPNFYHIISHVRKEYKKLISYLGYPCSNFIQRFSYISEELKSIIISTILIYMGIFFLYVYLVAKYFSWSSKIQNCLIYITVAFIFAGLVLLVILISTIIITLLVNIFKKIINIFNKNK